MAQREPALVTPFWVRIATETNLSPGWLLIAFPSVFYATYLLLEALFGRGLAAATDFGGDFQARIFPIYATCLGYVSMGATYVARGTFRDLDAIRPLLIRGGAAYAQLRDQLTRFDRRRLCTGSLLGVVFFCLLTEVAHGRWTQLWAGEWSLRATCIVAIAVAFWIVGVRVLVYFVDSARFYSQMGEGQVTVELLDMAPLSPLTRHGLRVVLISTILIAVSLIAALVSSGFGFNLANIAPFLMNLPVAVTMAAVFVLPVRGLRRQIRARKAEELARVRGEIHRDRELERIAEYRYGFIDDRACHSIPRASLATKLGAESIEAGGRLPGLLAYKHEIESVREWPFDAPTLTRFFLYVAIPLGSWVGGALVERLLGAALD